MEPELPVEGKPDGPPDLDANRNSVTSSDNRNLSMVEESRWCSFEQVSKNLFSGGELGRCCFFQQCYKRKEIILRSLPLIYIIHELN